MFGFAALVTVTSESDAIRLLQYLRPVTRAKAPEFWLTQRKDFYESERKIA